MIRVSSVVAGSGLLAATSGSIFPYMILYLHFTRHIATPVAGAIVASDGIASLLSSLAGGVLVDRFGARLTAIFGTLCTTVGYLSLYFARSAPWFIVAAVILGLANLRYAARNVATSESLPDDLTPSKFFSYDFMVTNAGFAIGTLGGGLLIRLNHQQTFLNLIAIAIICSLLATGAFWLLPPSLVHLKDRIEPKYSEAIQDPLLRWYLLWTVLLSLTSYASLDTGIPALIGITLKKSPQVIAIGYLINPVIIVLFQRPVYSVIARLTYRRTLQITAIAFGLAWMIPFATLLNRSTPFVIVDLAIFGIIFGIAEMCYSPVRTPLLLAIAPERLRGRYFGLGQFARATAAIGGPIGSTEAVGHGLAYYWLGALCVLASVNARVGIKLGSAVDDAQNSTTVPKVESGGIDLPPTELPPHLG